MRASCGHVLLHHPSLPIPIAATPTCGFPAPLIPHPDVVFSHNHTLTHLQFSAPLICVTSNKSKIYKSHWQEASHMMMLVVSLLAQQLFKETCQRKSEHKPPCRFKQNFEDTNWDDNQTKWMRTKSPSGRVCHNIYFCCTINTTQGPWPSQQWWVGTVLSSLSKVFDKWMEGKMASSFTFSSIGILGCEAIHQG